MLGSIAAAPLGCVRRLRSTKAFATRWDDAGPATKANATRWWVLRSATKAYAIRWWTRVATKAEATR